MKLSINSKEVTMSEPKHSNFPGFQGLSFGEAFEDESDFIPSRPVEHLDAFDMLSNHPPEFYEEYCGVDGEEADLSHEVSIQPLS